MIFKLFGFDGKRLPFRIQDFEFKVWGFGLRFAEPDLQFGGLVQRVSEKQRRQPLNPKP